MASGQNRAYERERTLADQQAATRTAVQNQAMQETPTQAAINAQNLRIINHQGDWKDSKDVNWASGQVAALKNQRAEQNRGAYTMGAQYADPNLLAGMGAQEEARAAQDEALSSEAAINEAKARATGQGLQSVGLTNQRYGAVLGSIGNTQMGPPPTSPWASVLMGGLSALPAVFSDIRLKENIQRPDDSGYVSWDWNDEAHKLGLFGSSAGVIAQEVELIHPEVVSTHPSGYKQVDYAALTRLEGNK